MMLPGDTNGEPSDNRTRIALEHPPDLDSAMSSPSSSLPSYLKSTTNAHPTHGGHRRQSKSASRHRSHTTEGSSSHLLARLIARDEEVREVHAQLVVANERLEAETTRANAAERRALEYFGRLKAATESKDRAEQDTARLRGELKLYELQLNNAQKEIVRAQDIINQVSSQRNEAEADAARARTKARKLQEEKLIIFAREEGRRQGYQEGLTKGRRLGYYEARVLKEPEESLPSRSRGQTLLHEVPSDEENEDDPGWTEERPELPRVAELRSRPAANRSQQTRPGSAPPVRTYDTARHAPTLPVPTLVTPAPIRSPSHEPRTPSPESEEDEPETIRPIPVRPSTTVPNPVPPPDGYIPGVDARTSRIQVPPPHELSIPVPATPSTVTTEMQEGRQTNPSESVATQNRNPDPHPPVRSRDYAYAPPSYAPVQHVPSVGSRASTHVSQYDLVSAPSRRTNATPLRHEMMYGRARSGSQPTRPTMVRTDRHAVHPGKEALVEQWRADPDVVSTATPTRGRSYSYVPQPAPPHHHSQHYPYYRPPPYGDLAGRSHTPIPTEPTAQPQHAPEGRGGLSREDLRQRFRQRESSNTTIPDIVVESPSESSSNTSHGTVVHREQPDSELLSPESANRALPRDNNAQGQGQGQERSSSHPQHQPPDPRQHPHEQQSQYQREDQRRDHAYHYPYYRPYQHQPLFYPYGPLYRSMTPAETTRVPQERMDRTGRRETDGRASALGRHERSASRGVGEYEVSPVPVGVVYPEPPVRPQTSHRQHRERDMDRREDRDIGRHENRDQARVADEGQGVNTDEARERGGEARNTGTENLRSQSPAPLQRPISLFDGD